MTLDAHRILSCAEAKVWESSLLKDEAAEWAAMQQAGAAIAEALLNDFKEVGRLPANARLLVLVGKGHNGGDALLAVKEILEKFPQAAADIVFCFGEEALRPLARRSFEALRSAVGQQVRSRLLNVSKFAGLHDQAYEVCLDGIFGFRFRPPIDAATAELIAQVNLHPHVKLRAAVDLSSGLGETNAATVFRADFTYATGIVKSPVIAEPNVAHVGRLRYLDLGFFKVERVDPNALQGADRIILSSILQPLAQLRPAQTDKRTYGPCSLLVARSVILVPC